MYDDLGPDERAKRLVRNAGGNADAINMVAEDVAEGQEALETSAVKIQALYRGKRERDLEAERSHGRHEREQLTGFAAKANRAAERYRDGMVLANSRAVLAVCARDVVFETYLKTSEGMQEFREAIGLWFSTVGKLEWRKTDVDTDAEVITISWKSSEGVEIIDYVEIDGSGTITLIDRNVSSGEDILAYHAGLAMDDAGRRFKNILRSSMQVRFAKPTNGTAAKGGVPAKAAADAPGASSAEDRVKIQMLEEEIAFWREREKERESDADRMQEAILQSEMAANEAMRMKERQMQVVRTKLEGDNVQLRMVINQLNKHVESLVTKIEELGGDAEEADTVDVDRRTSRPLDVDLFYQTLNIQQDLTRKTAVTALLEDKKSNRGKRYLQKKGLLQSKVRKTMAASPTPPKRTESGIASVARAAVSEASSSPRAAAQSDSPKAPAAPPPCVRCAERDAAEARARRKSSVRIIEDAPPPPPAAAATPPTPAAPETEAAAAGAPTPPAAASNPPEASHEAVVPPAAPAPVMQQRTPDTPPDTTGVPAAEAAAAAPPPAAAAPDDNGGGGEAAAAGAPSSPPPEPPRAGADAGGAGGVGDPAAPTSPPAPAVAVDSPPAPVVPPAPRAEGVSVGVQTDTVEYPVTHRVDPRLSNTGVRHISSHSSPQDRNMMGHAYRTVLKTPDACIQLTRVSEDGEVIDDVGSIAAAAQGTPTHYPSEASPVRHRHTADAGPRGFPSPRREHGGGAKGLHSPYGPPMTKSSKKGVLAALTTRTILPPIQQKYGRDFWDIHREWKKLRPTGPGPGVVRIAHIHDIPVLAARRARHPGASTPALDVEIRAFLENPAQEHITFAEFTAFYLHMMEQTPSTAKAGVRR